MRLKMPRLAPSLVPWLLPSIDSLFGVLKNGSAAALSGGVPGLDADWATPCESRRRRREREAYCSPWPSWETRPPSSGGPPANRPPYRVGRGLLGDVPGHRPAHDLAGEGACRGREIGPSFSCGHACDAARPKPVAPARGESALCQVQPGVSGSAFFWMRRFRAAPLPASQGFRMMRGTRSSLAAMPLFAVRG